VGLKGDGWFELAAARSAAPSFLAFNRGTKYDAGSSTMQSVDGSRAIGRQVEGKRPDPLILPSIRSEALFRRIA